MPNDRLRPGSDLSDKDWNDIYAEVEKYEAEQRERQVRDVIAIMETLEEIGYFTFPEDLSEESIAEEVVATLEGNARDAARMEQTWTDHRGLP